MTRVSQDARPLAGKIAVATAATRVMEKSGKTLATCNLVEEYGFTDVDGTHPR